VSTCLGEFEQLGFVRKERGTIIVTDPVQLEHYSCACFGLIRREFDGSVGDLAPVVALGEHSCGSATERPH
jgi:hypothetical protein